MNNPFKQKKLALGSICLIVISIALILFGRIVIGQLGLMAVLSWPELIAYAPAFCVAGYVLMGVGVAGFVYLGLRSRFTVDTQQVKTQGKRLKVLVAVSACALIVFSCFATPQIVSANTVATTGYYLATPLPIADWYLGNYSTGNIFAINGTSWANLMTYPTPAPWAADTGNYTKVWVDVLASISYGSIYAKEVAFPLSLQSTIPLNVQVICNYRGVTYTYVNVASSLGSPYTVSVGQGINNGFYIAADSGNRIVITSTNAATIQTQVYTSLPHGGSVYFKDLKPIQTVTIPANIAITIEYQGEIQQYNVGKYPTQMLSSELGGKFTNSSLLNIPLAPMTYVHDMIYDPISQCVWGVTRADDNINYVFKINENGTVTKQAFGTSGQYRAMMIIRDFGYFWTCTMDDPLYIIRINPENMSLTYYRMNTGENQGQSIVSDGAYLYVSTNTNPGMLVKFNPADETHTTVTTTGCYGPYWSVYDGRYIWLSGTISSSTADQTSIGRYDTISEAFTQFPISGANGTGENTFDGHYVWALNQNSASITRFDPATNTSKVLYFTSVLRVVDFADGYIWLLAGIGGDYYEVMRIAPTTLTTELYMPMPLISGMSYPHGFTFDGLNMWVGQWQNPANVTRFPAYYESIGGNNLIVLNGAQQLIYTNNKSATPLYITTNGLTATQSYAQIPVTNRYILTGITITVNSNSFDNVLAAALYSNSTQVSHTIQIAAGQTGLFSTGIDGYEVSKLSNLSLKIWAGASVTTGNCSIGIATIKAYG